MIEDMWSDVVYYWRLFFFSLSRDGIHKTFYKTFNFIFLNKSNNTYKYCVDVELINNNDSYEYKKIDLLTHADNPIVTIIIPAHNHWKYTYHCLLSIPLACQKYSYEVILADDASTDQTKDAEEYVQGLRIIRNQKSLGFIGNCNHAATFAKGEFIYFLNNDTHCTSSAIDALLDVFYTHSDAGIVGSKLIYSNGLLQEAGGIVWSDKAPWNYGRKQEPLRPEFCYLKDVDYVSGASLMIRKSIWMELGGFDMQYKPAYYEDTDLCFGVRSKGYRVIYQPKSIIIHYEGISHGKSIRSTVKKYQDVNSIKFRNKWRVALQKQGSLKRKELFLARDKSFHQPCVLFIDHYIPQYDKDAGSKIAAAFVKSLVANKCNVKFLGDNFDCQQPYADYLQGMGVEILYGRWYQNKWKKWLKDNGMFIDIVIFSRPLSRKYLKAMNKYTRAKFIYFGHDLHFLREQRRLEVSGENPGVLTVEEIKKQEIDLMRQMNLVLHLSQEEIDIVNQIAPDINIEHIIPYVFDTDKSRFFNPENRSDMLFVGGFNHPPNVDAACSFVKDIFPMIRQVHKGIKFHLVGSNPPKSVLELAQDDVIVHGYISDQELNNLYERIKLVVIPLRYGAGLKGKTIEAMSYGVPIVSTMYGVEGLPSEMRGCIHESSSEGFAQAVNAVYHDHDYLRRASEAGKKHVENIFSMKAMNTRWKRILDENVI